MELKLEILNRKLDQVLTVASDCLAEQRKTNGTVREHTVTIAKIWAIGTTAWVMIAALVGWDFWK
jgi:hypothetical protein